MMNDLQIERDRLRAEFRRIAKIEGYDPQSFTDLRIAIERLAELVYERNRCFEEGHQHEESQQRFDQFVERAEQDRALMLQLIQQLAQGRNGGN